MKDMNLCQRGNAKVTKKINKENPKKEANQCKVNIVKENI